MTAQTKGKLTMAKIYNEMNEFTTDWQIEAAVRPAPKAEGRISVGGNIDANKILFYLTTDLDKGSDAQDQAFTYGFDLQILFPRDGLPAKGFGLLVALDELLLDARGRREFFAWLMNQALPLPTIVLSRDFILELPMVLRPGLMVAARLSDTIFRALRDGHIEINEPDVEREGRNAA